jgi:YHS domain-containing protein
MRNNHTLNHTLKKENVMEGINKTALLIVVLFSFVCCGLLVSGTVFAGEQKTCPIMKGNPIDKKVYTDSDGKRVYFCCAGCIDVFKKDPAKLMKEMESQGIELEKVAAVTEKKESSEGHEGHNH